MKLRRVWQVRQVAIVGLSLLGICIGLFAGQKRTGFQTGWLALMPVCMVIVYKKKYAASLLAAFVMGLLFGLWRGDGYYQQIRQYEQYYNNQVTVVGVVSDDPGYNEKRQTEFHINRVQINNSRLPGRVRVRSIQSPAVARGDVVQVEGKMNQTLGTSRQGSISFPKITVRQKNTSVSESIRKRFLASVYSSLPEPQASLGVGFLVGVRSSLPTDFVIAMSVVGLTHIVAVSGYNLTIIVQFIKRFFEKRSAYQTIFFSLILIAGFLIITGWSPSIMRASVISGFSLLAWYYGRTFNPIVLILLGAAITGFINPSYVWGDVGWYLSFLAFTGVLLLAPLLMALLKARSRPHLLVAILIETLAAQAFALPYIALIFGEISLISPLANLLVIPLIPFAMLMIFIVGLIGIVSPVLALWIALPVRAVMTVIVWIIERLATIGWAKAVVQLSPWHTIFIYIFLAMTTLFIWLKLKKRAGGSLKPDVNWDLL